MTRNVVQPASMMAVRSFASVSIYHWHAVVLLLFISARGLFCLVCDGRFRNSIHGIQLGVEHRAVCVYIVSCFIPI